MTMLWRLVILFIAVPLIELALLIQVGKGLGLGSTLALILITGVIGASVARQQGFKVWAKIQSELRAGRMPAGELIDGLLILIGGLALLTPGLLTDACGFALMVPAGRRWVKSRLERRLRIMISPHRPRSGEDVIDV